jgi:ribonuclease E
MLDDDNASTDEPRAAESARTHEFDAAEAASANTATAAPGTATPRTRRRAASRPAGPPAAAAAASLSPPNESQDNSTQVATAASGQQPGEEPVAAGVDRTGTADAAPAESDGTASVERVEPAPAKARRSRRSTKPVATSVPATEDPPLAPASSGPETTHAVEPVSASAPTVALVFQPPEPTSVSQTAHEPVAELTGEARNEGQAVDASRPSDETARSMSTDEAQPTESDSGGERTSNRRRRSRGGRNRRKPADAEPATRDESPVAPAASALASQDAVSDGTPSAAVDVEPRSNDAEPIDTDESSGSSRRRRRRRRGGEADGAESSELSDKVTRSKPDTITNVEGSTRVEAKKQRRREGRDAGRRRAPILSESEFLARREAVDRVMAIRQRGGTTQIAVLEDGVLVEHYVALESQTSLIGNVYLGRVQNVLPSMEAAFVDIGKGRNAVLYAGEVDWALRGDLNSPRRIENALKGGQTVLVQVTKDPVGHKGARLTSQISLPGRYLVYVPGGGTNGISRKLPDTERSRLKSVLKDIVPDEAGVIIRTAAEGASEDELKRDVARLTARWEDIEKKSGSGQAPQLLYAEPDTTLKVVRDLFTEDFSKLVVSGDEAWDMVEGYVSHVAPDLSERLERFSGDTDTSDVFDNYRVDEQIAKALERKVWLPSGGSLVIDRTEAMTVVDVNTGKFTGAGGNLEQTVTKNNLEAAEEMVRQLRLRDIGGIIVIDFIDMVLEDNRDLVLRRLVECLGRDRTRHQVAEVTSLGLVQMTRKRIGTGLLEAFSTNCEHCNGRGVVIRSEPVTADDRSSSNGAGRTSSGAKARDEAAKPKPKSDEKAAPELVETS